VNPVEALQRGEIVLLETDTVVGLHGLASHAAVLDDLVRLKGSRPGRGFLLLFFDSEAVFEVAAACTPEAESRLRHAWPGPLTAVLEARSNAPAHWSSAQGTLAARVPAPGPLRDLLGQLPAPLFSTSANRSGLPPPRSMAEARAEFPELTAGEASGGAPAAPPSTVVDFTVDPPRVLREGAMDWPGGSPA
jgi:L-threonylcarbamoyladenylate synthase